MLILCAWSISNVCLVFGDEPCVTNGGRHDDRPGLPQGLTDVRPRVVVLDGLYVTT